MHINPSRVQVLYLETCLMTRFTYFFLKYCRRCDNDAISCIQLNIISIANMSVWIERIWNAHTHTHFHQDGWPPLFFFCLYFFFLLSLCLSHLLWPGGFDWQTHTHAFKKKKMKEDCYDYIRREKYMCLLCDYYRLILCFISSIQGGSSILYVKRDKEKERDKKNEEKTERERPLRIVA
jgi:hypothetical protein